MCWQLKAGRSESACYKVASDVKAEVTTACSNAQKMVNRINTGSSCCKTNAGAVTQAGSRLKEVQGKVDQCKSALRDVQDTKVSFPAISFKKLKKGKCASFFGGNSYKNAKRKFVNQKRKCNGLQGQVKAFKKGASDAKKARAEKGHPEVPQQETQDHLKYLQHSKEAVQLQRKQEDLEAREAHALCPQEDPTQ